MNIPEASYIVCAATNFIRWQYGRELRRHSVCQCTNDSTVERKTASLRTLNVYLMTGVDAITEMEINMIEVR